MIPQIDPQTIERRQNAIQVFLLLDDLSDGDHFDYHASIYNAIDEGQAVTVVVLPPPTDFVDGRVSDEG